MDSVRREVRSWSGGKPLVLSDEGLSFGRFMNRGRIWGDDASRIESDPERLAPRIQALFPRASVLLFTREQSAFTLSYYKQHAKIGSERGTLKDWFGRRSEEFFRLLDYATVIRVYEETLGANHLAVFPFEGLQSDTQKVALKEFVEQSLGINAQFLLQGYAARNANSDLGTHAWVVGGTKPVHAG